MVKTVVVAAIAAVIALTVFRKIYKDYNKKKSSHYNEDYKNYIKKHKTYSIFIYNTKYYVNFKGKHK